jgi:hypothetical protein
VRIRAAFGALRLGVAALCAAALVFRFVWGLGSATFTPGNFFAYLTVQSNLVFLVVTVLAGIASLRGLDDARWLDTARATALSLTVSSGVIFGLIVAQSGERGLRIDVPLSDQLLHFVLPAVAILDWVSAPGRGRAPWRTVGFTVTFTAAWGVFTLVRGEVVGWYPYFFLDPAQVTGLGGLGPLSAAALVLFCGVASGLVALSRVTPLAERASAPDGPRRSEFRKRLERSHRGREELVVTQADDVAGGAATNDADQHRLAGDGLKVDPVGDVVVGADESPRGGIR